MFNSTISFPLIAIDSSGVLCPWTWKWEKLFDVNQDIFSTAIDKSLDYVCNAEDEEENRYYQLFAIVMHAER